jgi:hypothetical protein
MIALCTMACANPQGQHMCMYYHATFGAPPIAAIRKCSVIPFFRNFLKFFCGFFEDFGSSHLYFRARLGA